MPASSLFAEMERPNSSPSNTMDEHRALQLALELSLLGINDSNGATTVPSTDVVPGISEAERTRRSQNMTECVAVPSSEHVAEIVGRQGEEISNKFFLRKYINLVINAFLRLIIFKRKTRFT